MNELLIVLFGARFARATLNHSEKRSEVFNVKFFCNLPYQLHKF